MTWRSAADLARELDCEVAKAVAQLEREVRYGRADARDTPEGGRLYRRVHITGWEVHAQGVPDVERGRPPAQPDEWRVLQRHATPDLARGHAMSLARSYPWPVRVRIVACERNAPTYVLEEHEHPAHETNRAKPAAVQGTLW